MAITVVTITVVTNSRSRIIKIQTYLLLENSEAMIEIDNSDVECHRWSDGSDEEVPPLVEWSDEEEPLLVEESDDEDKVFTEVPVISNL